MSEIKEFYKGYKYEMPSELFDIPIVTEEFEFTVPADDFIIGEDEKLIILVLQHIQEEEENEYEIYLEVSEISKDNKDE